MQLSYIKMLTPLVIVLAACSAAYAAPDDDPAELYVRGAGYFFGIEIVKNKATKEALNEDEAKDILFNFLSPNLYKNGLICRTDDRGEPVIQLSPPLISGPDELREIERILRKVLTEAAELVAKL